MSASRRLSNPWPRRHAARVAFVALVAVAANLLSTAQAGETLTAPRPPASSFPIGWYDSMDWSHLPDIADEGMNSVIPYSALDVDPREYLDRAQASGLKVMLEIPRAFVNPPDPDAVAAYVAYVADHPALSGWYLADEPTITPALGPLSPETAQTLYQAIKSQDPVHPVAIAFHPSEPAYLFFDAMDVVMFDDYPCVAGSAEYNGFGTWWNNMRWGAYLGEAEQGFMPVLPAFQPDGDARAEYRACTSKELRYMSFASLQMSPTGIMYWTRPFADAAWVDETVRPIVSELRALEPAIASGEIRGKVSESREDVIATVYDDPGKNRYQMVVVHHGPGTVSTTITIDKSLDAADKSVKVKLGPYEARVITVNRHVQGVRKVASLR